MGLVPQDQRIAAPSNHPDADTEWNEILRKKGILPEKPPSPTLLIEEALLEARRLARENRFENKELSDLSDLEDEEDGDFLETYRRKRLAELAALERQSLHGAVYPISKTDYAREITDLSNRPGSGPILVHLCSSTSGSERTTNLESALLSRLWRQAAAEYGEVKFCEIPASQAIEGYPERNCPTILVYDGGDIVKQIVTLAPLKGPRTSMRELDSLLIEVGAVKNNDERVLRRRREAWSRNLEENNNDGDEEEDGGWTRRGTKSFSAFH